MALVLLQDAALRDIIETPRSSTIASIHKELSMKDVGLITIHGMGEVDYQYYQGLEYALERKLGASWSRISFQNIQYAPILQTPQDVLWVDMQSEPSNKLNYDAIRQFFLYGFGDAGSLEYSSRNNPIRYLAVQEEIQRAIDTAYDDLGNAPDKPLVIIAHSLGCQIISNYLWDAKSGKYIFENSDTTDPDRAEFRKLTSLENLVTTGCNIPLFISGLENRECFQPPNDNFSWDNYYDADDVLGWPLRQLGESYEMVNDHHVNVGNILTSWNPLSHTDYWDDKDVINPLVDILNSKL